MGGGESVNKRNVREIGIWIASKMVAVAALSSRENRQAQHYQDACHVSLPMRTPVKHTPRTTGTDIARSRSPELQRNYSTDDFFAIAVVVHSALLHSFNCASNSTLCHAWRSTQTNFHGRTP